MSEPSVECIDRHNLRNDLSGCFNVEVCDCQPEWLAALWGPMRFCKLECHHRLVAMLRDPVDIVLMEMR